MSSYNLTMRYALLALALVYSGLAASGKVPHQYRDLAANAPPGISYTFPTGTNLALAARSISRPPKAQHVQSIKRVPGTGINEKSVAAILGAHQRNAGGWGYANVTVTNAFGTQYSVDAVWDGQPLKLLLDTGSSDTWAAQPNFTCLNRDGVRVPQGTCSFGAWAPKSFQYGATTNPATHMYGRYPDGQYIAGPFGFSDITVANLTVAKQQVCLANETFWLGNNFTSGHLGMAYPALTNSYTGDQDLQHLPISQVKYSPFFTTLVQEGTIDASFCLALDRNETTGIFALGGDVDVPGLDPDPSNTVALDMIIANLQGDANPQASYQYSFYTVIPDGWVYDQTNTTRKMPYIIDSGTTCNYLPPNIANDINSRFDPPGSYLSGYGAYYTECDAIPPSVAVVLDGVEFEISAEDMVLQHVRDESTDLCMTAIGNGGDGPYILGDGFLRNALVTMDIGQAKVWFTPRRY